MVSYGRFLLMVDGDTEIRLFLIELTVVHQKYTSVEDHTQTNWMDVAGRILDTCD